MSSPSHQHAPSPPLAPPAPRSRLTLIDRSRSLRARAEAHAHRSSNCARPRSGQETSFAEAANAGGGATLSAPLLPTANASASVEPEAPPSLPPCPPPPAVPHVPNPQRVGTLSPPPARTLSLSRRRGLNIQSPSPSPRISGSKKLSGTTRPQREPENEQHGTAANLPTKFRLRSVSPPPPKRPPSRSRLPPKPMSATPQKAASSAEFSDSSDDFEPSPRRSAVSSRSRRALRDDRSSMALHPHAGNLSTPPMRRRTPKSQTPTPVLTVGHRGRAERHVIFDGAHSELSDSDQNASDNSNDDGGIAVDPDDEIVPKRTVNSAKRKSPKPNSAPAPVSAPASASGLFSNDDSAGENILDAVRRRRRERQAANATAERAAKQREESTYGLPVELAALATDVIPAGVFDDTIVKSENDDDDIISTKPKRATPSRPKKTSRKPRVCHPAEPAEPKSTIGTDSIRKRARRVSRLLDLSSDSDTGKNCATNNDEDIDAGADAADSARPCTTDRVGPTKRVALQTPPSRRFAPRSVKKRLADDAFAKPQGDVADEGLMESDPNKGSPTADVDEVIVVSPTKARTTTARNTGTDSRARKRRRVVESSSSEAEDEPGEADHAQQEELSLPSEGRAHQGRQGELTTGHASRDEDQTTSTHTVLQQRERGSQERDPDVVINVNDGSDGGGGAGTEEPRTPSPEQRTRTRMRSNRKQASKSVLSVTPPSTPSPPSTKRRMRLRRLQPAASDSENEIGAGTTSNRPSSSRHAHGNLGGHGDSNEDGATPRKKEWYHERDIDEFSSHSEELPVRVKRQQHGTPSKKVIVQATEEVIEVPKDDSDPKVDALNDFSDEMQRTASSSGNVGGASNKTTTRTTPTSAHRPRARRRTTGSIARHAQAEIEILDLVDDDDDEVQKQNVEEIREDADENDSDDFMPRMQPLIRTGNNNDRARNSATKARRKQRSRNIDNEDGLAAAPIASVPEGPPAFNLHALCDEGESLGDMVARLGEEDVLQRVSAAQRGGRAIIGGEGLGIANTYCGTQDEDALFSRFSNTVVAAQMQRQREVTPVTEQALRGEYQFRYNGMERDGRTSSGARKSAASASSSQAAGGDAGAGSVVKARRAWWRGGFRRGGRGHGGVGRRRKSS